MALGEYLGAGSGTTKGLFHLNGNCSDDSGNAVNLTATNVTWTDGIIGSGAASLNGSTSKMIVANNMGITGGNVTLVIWINGITNLTLATTITFICQSATYTFSKYRIEYIPNTKALSFFRAKNNVANQGPTVTKDINSGKHCLALTYDGTNVRGYVDGELIAGPTAASGNGSTIGIDGFSIGCAVQEGTPTYLQYVPGVVDSGIIENRAWSDAEIKRHYTNSKGRFATL